MVDICIIGGGASGMTAAITAGRLGCRVALIEASDRVGKKLLSTGNGRCNLSNTDLSHHHYNTPQVMHVFRQVGLQRVLEFFESCGLLTFAEQDGRIFPYSKSATSVLDVMRFEMQRLPINIITGKNVSEIKVGKFFEVCGIKSAAVIVCCGSPAGGACSGYELLKNTGHRITSLFPALAKLKTDDKVVNSLMGIKHMANGRLFVEDKMVAQQYGEILFANNSLSGTPIFFLSRYASEHIGKRRVEVSLDLFSHYTHEQLAGILNGRRVFDGQDRFCGLLPKRLGLAVIKKLGNNPPSRILKDFRFNIVGINDISKAQIVLGGARDFNMKTLESNHVKNLFAAGEVLDVDGDCGGYNLQWAWSSGMVSGKNAAKAVKNM